MKITRHISMIRNLMLILCFVSGLFLFSSKASAKTLTTTIDGVTYYYCYDTDYDPYIVRIYSIDPGESTVVHVPEMIDGYRVTEIGTYDAYYQQEFDGSRVTELTLPRFLRSIIFSFNDYESLTSLTIPYSVEFIETSFHYSTMLTSLYIPPATTTIRDSFAEMPMEETPVVRGVEDSYAQRWAASKFYDFEDSPYIPYSQTIDCSVKELNYTYKDLDQGDTYYYFRATAENWVDIYTSDESVVLVGQPEPGYYEIAPQHAGKAILTLVAEPTLAFASAKLEIPITVTKASQTITLGKKEYTGACGKSFNLNAKAMTTLQYQSSAPKTVKVDSKGKVTCLKPGKATITVSAAGSRDYLPATHTVTVTSNLAKPSLSIKVARGKAKLSWKKVPAASHYLVYVKFPGSKKYRRVLTKPSRVRSVTHKGLKKKSRYSYKIRARVKIGGKYYYSPYSRVITIKAR